MTLVRFHLISSPYGDQRTGPTGDLREMSLVDFRSSLVHVLTENKFSKGAYCPADFDYSRLAAGDRVNARKKTYVSGSSDSVWLDVDKLPESEWTSVLEYVAAQRWEAEAWSTWSYVPGGGRVSARMRVTVSRAHLSPAEVQSAREGLARELTAVVRPLAESGPRSGLIADAQCFQPAAVFYVPTCHPAREGTGRTWVFDGPCRPNVDELVGRAERSAREVAKGRLLASGSIVVRDVSEPASEADRAYAAEWFERTLASVLRPEELPGRKNRLYSFGGRVGKTVGIGGLDLDVCSARVLSCLQTVHSSDVEALWPHYERGLQTADQVEAVRSEDRLIDEATEEVLEDRLETRVWSAVERDLAANTGESGTLESARAGLADALKAATTYTPAAKRKLLVIQGPAGLGKTTGLAKVAAVNVANRVPTALLVPNHAVAHEFMRTLPEAARGDTVHLHSPLVQVPGVPFCELPEAELELAKRRVFEFGGLQHDVCKSCRLSETCEAQKAWKSRNKRAEKATLVVASYQNAAAVDTDEHTPRVLIVDEQPPIVDTAEITPADIRAAKGLPVDVLDALIKALEKGTALPPEPVTYVPTIHSSVSENVEAAERAAVKLRRYHFLALQPGSTVFRRGDGSRVASAPSAVMTRLMAGSGTILSATPATDVLGAAEVVRLDVTKHALHERWMFPRADVARQGDRKLGRRLVEEAGLRVAKEAGAGEALLVTYLALAEELEEWSARPSNLRIAYYGNVRGRNDWEKCSAVICVGTPWDRHLEEARALGMEEGSEAAWKYARARASAELRQAVERVRSVSRPDERVWMGVVGNVAPWGWSTADTSVGEWGEAERTSAMDAGAATLAAKRVGGWTVRLLSSALGVSESQVQDWARGRKPIPVKHLAVLAVLPSTPFNVK